MDDKPVKEAPNFASRWFDLYLICKKTLNGLWREDAVTTHNQHNWFYSIIRTQKRIITRQWDEQHKRF